MTTDTSEKGLESLIIRRMAVSITGRIVDERYTRLLLERTDLDLLHVMLLDRVQKKTANRPRRSSACCKGHPRWVRVETNPKRGLP